MSNTQMIQYHGLLLDQPHIRLHKMSALIPESLLLDDKPQEPLHDCL